MPKKKAKIVTNATLIREIVKKTKELDTKPSDELNELIAFEKSLAVGFQFKNPTETNFDKLKSELPIDLQVFISDQNKVIERENYAALAETITNFRRAAKYLMAIVTENEESRKIFEEMSLGAFEFYQHQRKELNKKFSRKHKMLSVSGRRWLKKDFKKDENPDIPFFLAGLTFNADFALDFESTYLMKVLEGIDARRLRICSHCSHLFWAFRLDQNYCGDACQKRAKRNRAYKRQKENKEKK